MTLESIVSRLQSCRGTGTWQRIAVLAKIDYGTISRIARGKMKNPGIVTCHRLTEAMDVVDSDRQAASEGA